MYLARPIVGAVSFIRCAASPVGGALSWDVSWVGFAVCRGVAPLASVLTKRTWRLWLRASGVCGAVFILSGCSEDVRRPNVVLIVADTLRADALGAYGNPLDPCPELDQLADGGVLFERVIAPCPWTKPSIAAMLTGHYPRTLGIYEESDDALRASFQTLAEYLSTAGYQTFGVTANPMINSVFGFDQGFDVYLDSVSPDVAAVGVSGGRLAPARVVFQRALELVDAAVAGRPCYLQLNVMEMHEHWKGAGAMTRPEMRDLFPGADSAPYLQALRQVSIDVDAFLGELLKKPGFEDTVVIFTSDHGEGLNSHPGVADSKFHGAVLYESNTHVPLVFRYDAGGFAQARISAPVGLIDVTPTILDLLSIDPIDAPDGQSLLPLMRGASPEEGRAIVTETFYRSYDKRAVFVDGFQYHRNFDGHPGLLPTELQLAGGGERGAKTDRSKEHPKLARRLSQYLERWDASHPRARAQRATSAMSPELEAQLRAIGYLGGSDGE